MGAVELVKVLAFVAMVIDHIDLIVLDRSVPWMHAVGRFAYPAFAVAFGLGLAHSHDIARSAARLVLPAAVAQLAWIAAGVGPECNVLFTFSLAALLIVCFEHRHFIPWPLPAAIAAAGFVWPIEGGMAGVALVFGGWWLRAHGGAIPLTVAAAPWLALAGTPGLFLGLAAAPLAASAPALSWRFQGLAWLYGAHIAALALLAQLTS